MKKRFTPVRSMNKSPRQYYSRHKYQPTMASPMLQRLRRSGQIHASPALSLESLHLDQRRRSFSLDDLGNTSPPGQERFHASPPEQERFHASLPGQERFIQQQQNDLSKSQEDKSSVLDLDDTDEDLDDLPSQEESPLEQQTRTEPEASSLSTIREGSPINSVEEWSPSPATEDDDDACSSIPDNRSRALEDHHKTRSLPKGFVHNYLNKWKNMMKK